MKSTEIMIGEDYAVSETGERYWEGSQNKVRRCRIVSLDPQTRTAEVIDVGWQSGTLRPRMGATSIERVRTAYIRHPWTVYGKLREEWEEQEAQVHKSFKSRMIVLEDAIGQLSQFTPEWLKVDGYVKDDWVDPVRIVLEFPVEHTEEMAKCLMNTKSSSELTPVE